MLGDVHTAGTIDWQGLVERHARDLGITQAELFRRAKLAFSNWGRWKSGKTGPTVENLNKLLKVTSEPTP